MTFKMSDTYILGDFHAEIRLLHTFPSYDIFDTIKQITLLKNNKNINILYHI